MSMLDTIRDSQTRTMQQSALDHIRAVENNSTNRTTGGEMGKLDFLKLLSAQLRYQDPLNPQSDSEFASGLAQFSTLEQMQNMNHTLESMTGLQAYTLVGKYVIAETVVDGVLTEIPGIVDSIFTKDGITYAQIGEFMVPISSIIEVFDSSNMLTPEMLMQTSNNLIGRTVIAEVDGEDIEGVVTRVLSDRGRLIAQIDDGSGEPKFVPVNAIVDIRETGTEKFIPKPVVPPQAVNFRTDGEGGFYELCEMGETEIGHWKWNVEKWEWIYTCFKTQNEQVVDETIEDDSIVDESIIDESTSDEETTNEQAAA